MGESQRIVPRLNPFGAAAAGLPDEEAPRGRFHPATAVSAGAGYILVELIMIFIHVRRRRRSAQIGGAEERSARPEGCRVDVKFLRQSFAGTAVLDVEKQIVVPAGVGDLR